LTTSTRGQLNTRSGSRKERQVVRLCGAVWVDDDDDDDAQTRVRRLIMRDRKKKREEKRKSEEEKESIDTCVWVNVSSILTSHIFFSKAARDMAIATKKQHEIQAAAMATAAAAAAAAAAKTPVSIKTDSRYSVVCLSFLEFVFDNSLNCLPPSLPFSSQHVFSPSLP
jgi:hypothetical protein